MRFSLCVHRSVFVDTTTWLKNWIPIPFFNLELGCLTYLHHLMFQSGFQFVLGELRKMPYASRLKLQEEPGKCIY